MYSSEVVPEALLKARRALDALKEVQILQDWIWNKEDDLWYLCCRLSPSIPINQFIPISTDWYVLVSPLYPWGNIDFYPAITNGIEVTFPHQRHNGTDPMEKRWRKGNICLGISVGTFNRYASATYEPFDVDSRLLWYFERALYWLKAASRGELAIDGENFELPHFRGASGTVGFSENRRNYFKWIRNQAKYGFVDYICLRNKSNTYAIMRFILKNKTIIHEPSWGSFMNDLAGKQTTKGAWILLNDVPIIEPWQAPMTWGEMRKICTAQSIDLLKILEELSSQLRDGAPHLLLIGFPIPKKIGDTPCQIFWQAIQLPALSYKASAKGFSRNPWQKDQLNLFAENVKIEWIKSQNWGSEYHFARGGYSIQVRSAKITMIGAGALGSVVAELLARAGAYTFTVIDEELFEMGNVVRHTLTMAQIELPKARELCGRLNTINPHGKAIAIADSFPLNDQSAINDSQIIIDTTGSDDVLASLSRIAWDSSKTFISCSLGFMARTLFIFAVRARTFHHDAFLELIRPWLETDFEEYDYHELPREGVGCWHPLFPARIDDITLMASTAVKQIENIMEMPPDKPQLFVFKQDYEEDRFCGITLISQEEYNG